MGTHFKHYGLYLLVFIGVMLFSLAASSNHRYTANTVTEHSSDSSHELVAQNKKLNLRFGSINVHSRKGTYDIVAFTEYDYSINLFAENSSAKNVRVRAGIEDGTIFYDKTFSYISASAPKRIEFSYAMPVGAHTMIIEVDPENTINEFDETDNKVTRTFIANLRIHAF